MNVLFLNSIRDRVWGGGEKWMLTAGVGLSGRGHGIAYCGREGSTFLSRCAEAGFTVFPLRIGSDFGLGNILRLRSLYRERRIDAVVANFNKDVRLAGLAACGGGPDILARNGLPILQNNWRYRLTYTKLVRGIITNTEAIKRRYLSYGWLHDDFIKVIHNGIDAGQRIDFPRAEVLAGHGIPDGRPVIGIFGRLVGQKGHDRFLDVARRVLNELHGPLFIVVGDGPLDGALRQRAGELGIAESVRFMGFQREVMPLYSICDLVLLTSRSEGLPNAVLEAMLAGRATIAFDVGGVRELLRTEDAGVVIPAGDVDGMTKAALDLLGSAEKRGRIGRRARRLAIEEFSVEKMTGELAGWLEEVSTRRGRARNGSR